MQVTRPALRYFGGKWRIAKWIIDYFPKHRIYVEPYGGGGSVLLQKVRSYSEVYNDLDGEVVNVFRVLRDPARARQLAELLTLTPYSREEWVAAYEPCADPVERARRAIVRSFAGFGSDSTNINRKTGFRSNANRQGTTPAVDWSRYPSVIPAFTGRFRGVLIDQKPALEVIQEHDTPKTLHYIDPPYPSETRSSKCRYAWEMTRDDHCELARVAKGLMGFVVISGYRCELYSELFGDWKVVEKTTLVFSRSKRVECLWLNPAAAKWIQQASFVWGEDSHP